jgi:hypothetical protein
MTIEREKALGSHFTTFRGLAGFECLGRSRQCRACVTIFQRLSFLDQRGRGFKNFRNALLASKKKLQNLSSL